ncbi:MAG TPA: PilZ domain-containing protein [Thermoanaerobaculia bacterium]|jgi:hypothetical protein|nr:PilZ domain-containing protein [Thermoanaerobaculia bacterium]
MDEGSRDFAAQGEASEDGAEAAASAASSTPAESAPAARAPSAPLPSRTAPRLSYEAVVRLSCAGRRGIHTGFVRDISRGGMFLRLVDPEPVGRRLGFELFLPGWRMPARGVGEVAWQRPSYEGPGRPPGMAIRFVALEQRAIEMIAALLPGGEAPSVEVLAPPPLPPVRRDERREGGAIGEEAAARLAGATAIGAAVEPSLEALLAASGVSSPAPAEVERPLPAELAEDGPMIFVPPPPPSELLPQPALPAGPPVHAFAEPPPAGSRLRWGSAAAGIAALGAIASLLVVGAARRDVLPGEGAAAVDTAMPTTTSTAASAAVAEASRESAAAAPRTSGDATIGDAPTAPGAAAKVLAESPAASAGNAPRLQPAPGIAPTAADTQMHAAPLNPATRLTGLRWEPLPTGGTRIVIALDGAFAAARLRASRIGGESPRLVVRLLGLAGGAPLAPWEPATGEVRRIRAGRHDGEDGGEIHLVLDLADPAVRLVASEVRGGELRLDLAKAPDVR